MPSDILIEGLLFYKAAPQKKQLLCRLFDLSAEELAVAVVALKERLQTGALRLLETSEELQLVTCPELAPVIAALRKGEQKTGIGRAGAETLAIILYQEPITRAEIDRVRGVNSSFILRNLLVRGLIERSHNMQRGGYEFRISASLLAHLGLTNKTELSNYGTILNALEDFNRIELETNQV